MIRNLIERLKKIRLVRRLGKRAIALAGFPCRLVNRDAPYILYSADSALSEALNSRPPEESAAKKTIGNKRVEEISLHHNVITYPLGAGKDGKYSGGLINGGTCTLVEEAIHFNGDLCQEFPDNFDPTLLQQDLPVIKQCVLYAGILYNNFGHFILESLSRLWAYEYVKELDPYIIFYSIAREPDYLSKNSFIYQALKGFNIPLKRVIFVKGVTRLENVLVPMQKYGFEYCKTPDTSFRKFVNSFTYAPDVPAAYNGADKVYVSRTKLPVGMGKPIGEVLLERYLASEGYKIFYPEKHNLYQQLSVYSRAKKLIFCDGGAIHGCILLPNLQADVAVVARRKDPRWDLRGILDQFKGYGKYVLWIDEVKGQYQFGMETWVALSLVDWLQVSKLLKDGGFVNTVFDEFSTINYAEFVRAEVKEYMMNIRDSPLFIDYLITKKEIHKSP